MFQYQMLHRDILPGNIEKGGAAESNDIVKDLCEMGQVDVGELLAM